ncbi:MAG: hypothetical protein ACI9IP_003543 [Arcticibacterium sp.]|jgi:hypothetical protein
MSKKANHLFFYFLYSLGLLAQNLEVTGELMVKQTQKINTADSVVVRLNNGTFAIRDADTFGGATGNGIAYVQDNNNGTFTFNFTNAESFTTPVLYGPTGTNGNTVMNGTASPTAEEGTNGDFFINTTNYEINGPKTAGTWGTATSLKAAAPALSPCGSWLIPYMPFSSNSYPVIYLTRVPASWTGASSDASSDIIVDAVDEFGNGYDFGVVTTTGTSRVTKLATLITQKLLDDYAFNYGKLALRIRVDNPGTVHL